MARGRRNSVAALQTLLDEPPDAFYSKWIKERVALAAPRDERLQLVGGRSNRLRLRSANGIGAVSDTIWNIIFQNQDRHGYQVAQKAAVKDAAAA